MPFKAALLLVAIGLADSIAVADAEIPKELADRIQKIVRQHYPDVEITQKNGWLSAKHGTMIFTVHRHLKTGEILETTDRVEGPNAEGFVLSLSVQEGKYEGAAVVPQILGEPYWQTYIDRPKTEDGQGHYVINFSYGSRLDKDFMKTVFEALPKSKPPGKKR